MKFYEYFLLSKFCPSKPSIFELFIYGESLIKVLMKFKTKDIFSFVEIENISYCNRKCRYCPSFLVKRKKKIMPKSIFSKVISDLNKIDFNGLIIFSFYGEPLLDSDLIYRIKKIKLELNKCKILVYTNDDFVNKFLSNKLFKSGLDYLIITNHDNKRIKTDMKFKNKIFIKNLDKNELSNRAGLVNLKNIRHFNKCIRPSLFLTINIQGDIILCCNDFFSKHKFGNIMKKDNMNIWKSPKFKRIRKQIRDGKFSLELCKKCRGDI